MEPDFPDQLRSALVGRPNGIGLDELLEACDLTPQLVLSHLRKAERAGAVRYVRGRYELTVSKVTLADTSAGAPVLRSAPEDEPEDDPVDEPPPSPLETRPAVTATMGPGHEAKPAVPAIKPAKHATPAPAKDISAMANRECNTCHEVKDLKKDFPPHKQCRDGFEPRCRECKSKAQAAAYQAKTGNAGKRPARVPAPPAPARANGTAGVLEIPASSGLQASVDEDGMIVLVQGEDTINLLPVQMDQLGFWWKAQANG